MRRDIASINDEMRTLKNQIGFLSMKVCSSQIASLLLSMFWKFFLIVLFHNDETNARVSAVVREHEAMSANQRKWMQKMEAANAQLQRKAEQVYISVLTIMMTIRSGATSNVSFITS